MNEAKACLTCGAKCFRLGNTNVWLEISSQRAIVKVGEIIRVIGKNFGVSTGSATVRIDTVQVLGLSFLGGTDDENLIFEIPSLPGVPAFGRPAFLDVGNGFSVARRVLTVLPFQALRI